MSDVLSFAARKAAGAKLRIGLLRLTDSAPVIAAYEFGFFADEGLDVELSIEPSWANIADKLTYGFLDAAVIVPPLAFAIQLGIRGVAQPLHIPYGISAGGNTITVANALASDVEVRMSAGELSAVEAFAAALRARKTTLGVVHAYSTHNLLLRYWLAMAGIVANRDVALGIVFGRGRPRLEADSHSVPANETGCRLDANSKMPTYLIVSFWTSYIEAEPI